MYQSIITEVDRSVGILTLNKAERHNALDEQLIAEMTRALLDLEADPLVRIMVISSSGRSFCSGSDLDWIRRNANFTGPESLDDATAFARLLSVLNGLSKPTIARVQGSAFGGGIGIIAACDIAVATYDAQFAITEGRLGLLPAQVCPYLLAAVGERYCRRYMLSAERFSAAEAYRIGLVHEIVPGEEELDDAIGEIVENLLKNGPAAQAETKALIQIISGQPIDDSTVDETIARFVRVRQSAEGMEGLAAFLERRQPNWVE